ncbi:MAG: ATP synthase F1 subunit epsilon [Pseudomonadota bacterium]
MADTITFELVSPERKLAAVTAHSVTLPGSEGDLTAMPSHAPVLTALRPGVLTVRDGAEETAYVVTGGFAEISATEVGVIAEDAAELASVTRAWIEDRAVAAEKALAEAGEERHAALAQRLADIRQLPTVLGL